MNVKNNFYGIDALSPTGPRMLGNIILRRKLRTNIDMAHYEKGGYIIYKNRFVISTEYPEYNKERSQAYSSTKIKRYDIMWRERKIYK
jgi:hypothetical protein